MKSAQGEVNLLEVLTKGNDLIHLINLYIRWDILRLKKKVRYELFIKQKVFSSKK